MRLTLVPCARPGTKTGKNAEHEQSKNCEGTTMTKAVTTASQDAKHKALMALSARIEQEDVLGCVAGGSKTIVCDGNPDAALLVIGLAPGYDEVRCGRPFVGSSGRNFDDALLAAGLDGAQSAELGRETASRASLFITNSVFWLMEGADGKYRNPKPAERKACQPFVAELLAIVRPRVVLLLGNDVCATYLDSTSRSSGNGFADDDPIDPAGNINVRDSMEGKGSRASHPSHPSPLSHPSTAMGELRGRVFSRLRGYPPAARRGDPVEVPALQIVPTYHPSPLGINPGNRRPLFEADIRFAVSLARGQS